jgi:alpha-mannosidase
MAADDGQAGSAGTPPQRAWEIYVVPGAHFDLGWCASIAETLGYGADLIRRAIDELTGPHPDYRFTIEYALFLKHFLRRYPEYRQTVQRLLDEGRLEVCSTMTGAMEQILDGEATVRVVAEAQRWARRELGRSLPTAQHSDLPGHTIQIPQILAKSGVRYLAYSRFRPPHGLHWWRAPDGSRVLAAHHTVSYGWGFTLLRPDAARQLGDDLRALAVSGAWPATTNRLLMTGQSDLLLLEPEVVGAAAALTREGVATFRLATLTQFFEAVAAEAPELPVYQGEAPYGFYSLPAWEPDTYQAARTAEHTLAAAETFASLRDLLGLGRYPHDELAPAWEDLFYPQDHNVGGRHGEQNKASRQARAAWALTAGREVVEECLASFATHIRYPDQEGAWSRDPAARRAGWTFGAIRTRHGLPVVVANPLAWPRTDVVQVRLEFATGLVGAVRVVDDTGREVPSQVLSWEDAGRDRPALYNVRRASAEVLFVARDVPACGYRTYYLEALPAPAGLAGATERLPVQDDLILEAGAYRLAITAGRVTSLVERPTGRELVGPGVAGPAATGPHRFGEVVVLEDLLVDLEDGPIEQVQKVPGRAEARPGPQPPNFTGRAWTTAAHPARVVRIERGPVRTQVVLAGQVLGGPDDAAGPACPVEQTITLYEHLPRVEVTLALDWHGKKNTLVRAAYPLAVPRATITYETPYGSVVHGRDELPNSYRGEGTRFVQKWVDFSAEDGSWGITWSSQVCAHTLHADAAGQGSAPAAGSGSGTGAGLSPLLVRTAYSCGTPFLWYTLEGRHTFRFAFQPHAGTWRDAHAWRLGWEYHAPLAAARLATARPLAPIPGRDTLPERLSLCTLAGEHATVGTIYQPEPDLPRGTYVLRLVEVEGRGGPARLTFCRPVLAAARTNLVGDEPQPLPVEGGKDTVVVELGPYEIATIRVTLAT